jgi:hypothetical protein
MFAKMQAEGRGTGIDKTVYHAEIVKRAAETRRAGESDAKAYTRIATETEDGRMLLAAYKAAPPPDAKQDDVPRVDPKGPAEQAMEEAVATHRADAAAQGLPLSREQAFTAVYTHPAHRGLKSRYDAEMLGTRAPQ